MQQALPRLYVPKCSRLSRELSYDLQHSTQHERHNATNTPPDRLFSSMVDTANVSRAAASGAGPAQKIAPTKDPGVSASCQA